MGSVLNPLMRSSKLRTVRGVARTQKATPFGHADGYCGLDDPSMPFVTQHAGRTRECEAHIGGQSLILERNPSTPISVSASGDCR